MAPRRGVDLDANGLDGLLPGLEAAVKRGPQEPGNQERQNRANQEREIAGSPCSTRGISVAVPPFPGLQTRRREGR